MKPLIRLPPALILLTVLTVPLSAHEARPAYLRLTHVTPDTVALVFTVPAMGVRRLGLYPRLPQKWEAVAPPLSYNAG